MSISRCEPFSIEIQPDRDRVVVAPHGELDIATAQDLEYELDRLVERGVRTIVIDLRALTFIDSSGVHLLVRQSARPGTTVSVIAGPQRVSRVLDIAGACNALSWEPARPLMSSIPN